MYAVVFQDRVNVGTCMRAVRVMLKPIHVLRFKNTCWTYPPATVCWAPFNQYKLQNHTSAAIAPTERMKDTAIIGKPLIV